MEDWGASENSYFAYAIQWCAAAVLFTMLCSWLQHQDEQIPESGSDVHVTITICETQLSAEDCSLNMEMNLVNGALKTGNLKRDIPDPVPGS